MKPLGRAVAKLAAPVLGRRGFGEAQVVLEWPSVVGQDLARDSLPVKLSFDRSAEERVGGTLHLRAAPGAALEIQHLAPIIIERINGFFGYRAVARLAIRQGPLPGSAPARKTAPPPVPAADREALERRLAAVEDPDLRAALIRLGCAVLAATPVLSASKKTDNL